MSKRKLFSTLLISALFVLLLAACGSTATNSPVEVKVTISEYAIESSITNFKVGVPYHFVVTNKGAIPHEIMLMNSLDATGGMGMDEMDAMALAHLEENDLPSGGTATFDYTFIQPAATGELEFACHLPGHYEVGMKLSITVTQ